MKNIGVYVALVALVFLGDRLAGLYLENTVKNSQFRYSRLYDGRGAAEILLIGNSRGLAFFEPYITSITAKTTCNLSYNGLPADAASALVADYIDRYPALKTVVIDVTLLDRENDALLAGFTCYVPWSQRLDTLINRKLSHVWHGAQLAHLFRYNNEVFQRALFYRQKSDRDWLLDRVINQATVAKAPTFEYNLAINPYLIGQITQMTTYAKGKGKSVHLVIGPYFPGFNVGNLSPFKAAIEAATGSVIRDYSQALTDQTDFGDLQHTNQQGSKKYMDILFHDGVFR